MAGGNPIRGSRIGAGRMGEAERGEAAPRRLVAYYCAHDHVTPMRFAEDVTPPETWDCPRCGLPAGQDPAAPPPVPRAEPYKTHLAYVRERRSDAEGNALLDEALARINQRRTAAD
jgi:hypothetical protein